MGLKYIILICSGGLFVFLIFLYSLIAFERKKSARRNQAKLLASYNEKNLRKMEYDIAFYDEETHRRLSGQQGDRQVTIDDLLNEKVAESAPSSEKALFVHVEDEGVEEIVGNYNPNAAGR